MRNADKSLWNIYITFFLLTCTFSTENIGISYLLQDAADNNGALCLDGSPSRYYINTNVTETRKFVMFLQGGGWCAGLYQSVAPNTEIESCFDRRETRKGSTRNDNRTTDLNEIGVLHNNKTMNPLFYNWVKIFVRYCDGASFRGNRHQSIYHTNNASKHMYFRGKRILSAVFDHVWNNFGLSQATDFVFSGGSAGGLAIFLNADDIASRFTNTKVVALPLAGYFIDYNGYDAQHVTNYSNAMKWICLHQNVSVSSAKCMSAQHIATDIHIPVFVVNSRYDRWQMDNILFSGEHYASMHWDLVNEFGDNFTKIITQNYLNYAHIKNHSYGAFISSCYLHESTSIEFWNGIKIDNYSAAYAFKQFYESIEDENSQYLWYDGASSNSSRYPCNTCCSQYFPMNICVSITTFNNQAYEAYPLQFRGYFRDYPFYSANDSRLYIVRDGKLWIVGHLLADDDISWECDSERLSRCNKTFESNYGESIKSIDIWECELNSTVTTSSTPRDQSIYIKIVIYAVIVVVSLSCFAVMITFRYYRYKTNNFTRVADDEFGANALDDDPTTVTALQFATARY